MGDMFGKAWRKHRRRAGVLTKDMAVHMGLKSDRYLKAVEAGKEPPLSDERIVQACELIGSRDVAYWQGLAAFDRAIDAIPPVRPDIRNLLGLLAERTLTGHLTEARVKDLIRLCP